ncbi:hypothetical protein [Hyphomicrobium sp. DMF-1]|uniref:restriction endonuclease subunit S n=1 Tax=Hyphomicrobium sp. DMF-1 TaxID=3019544 RepID=UPI0022EBB082|nr:hypothetical protein [Hyphomicrobium sp. DMF-1]WBT39043.1 hypothetical protein PE058_03965 [Hyphomicrobium sp. DMF-1]
MKAKSVTYDASSWRHFPFWRLAKQKSISNRQDEGLLSVYLDRGVIPYSEGGGLVHKPAESLEKYQLVEPGDFVLNNQQAWRGSVGVSDHRGIVSPAYLVFDLDRKLIYPNFAKHLFRDRWYVDQFMLASLSVGDIQRQIKWPHLRKISIALPSMHDQKQRARLLDRETARIDSLIEKKARFIDLLKWKLVDFADLCVTGRDQPDRKMKKADIPWAPLIPDEWKVKKAKYLFREMARPVLPEDDVITAFRDGQVCLRTKRRTEGYTFADKEVGYQHICKGDLVIHTMDAFAGAIGVSEDDGKATGEYSVCAPRSRDICPEYYALLLRCMARRNYIYVLCPAVRERAPRFRFVRFAPVLLPVPSQAEQRTIVNRIEQKATRLKALIVKTERSIDLLKEKRSALITAAVTGKIDVRAAA